MALFGKKKVPEPEAETPILNTKSKPKIEEPPKTAEVTEDQKLMIQRFNQFSDLRAYTAADFLSMPQAAMNAEMCNLLAACYAELRNIRELLQEQIKE